MDLDQSAIITFFVQGFPSPGGSKTFLGVSKKGKGILVDAGGEKTKTWRAAVRAAATPACLMQPLTGPLSLTVKFTMPRVKGHYFMDKKRWGKLRPEAPDWHTIAPDTTKLLRSTEDALKGLAWVDDSQICKQTATKMYGDLPGAWITIQTL